MKLNDELITWSGLHGTRDATVRIRIFEDMIFRGRVVVVMTEPADNEGTSVTNGVERIAAIVCDKFNLNPSNVTFIEHYPPRGFRGDQRPEYKESFDVVTFSAGPVDEYRTDRPGGRMVKTFKGPTWKRADWPNVRRSIFDPNERPAGSNDFAEF